MVNTLYAKTLSQPILVQEKNSVLKETILHSSHSLKTYKIMFKYIRRSLFVLTKNRWKSMETSVLTSHALFKYNFKSVFKRKIKNAKNQKKSKSSWETSFCFLFLTKKSSNLIDIKKIASWSRQVWNGFQSIHSSNNRTLIRSQSLIFIFKMIRLIWISLLSIKILLSLSLNIWACVLTKKWNTMWWMTLLLKWIVA